jgi:hypothetical protein
MSDEGEHAQEVLLDVMSKWIWIPPHHFLAPPHLLYLFALSLIYYFVIPTSSSFPPPFLRMLLSRTKQYYFGFPISNLNRSES